MRKKEEVLHHAAQVQRELGSNHYIIESYLRKNKILTDQLFALEAEHAQIVELEKELEAQKPKEPLKVVQETPAAIS
jgi:hypothetical protein